jgi:hypothetical protein
MKRRAGLRIAAVLAADLGTLRATLPSMSSDRRGVAAAFTAPHAYLDRVGSARACGQLVDAAAASLAVVVAAALVVIAAGALPGSAGRAARQVSRHVLPRALAGLLVGSAGLGTLIAPAVASAAIPPAATTNTVAFASVTGPITAPITGPAPVTPPTIAPPVLPGLALPRLAPPAIPAIPARLATPEPAPAMPQSEVVVAPGDSLWSIAARALGPDADPAQIAASWPRWFAANRAVIGSDPDHIIAGQHLQPPQRQDPR